MAETAPGRRGLAPDLLGHGETVTAEPDQNLSFGPQAEMLIELVEALGCGPVDLVGNDSGGAICQASPAGAPTCCARWSSPTATRPTTPCPKPWSPSWSCAGGGEALALFESMAGDLGLARAVLGTGLAEPDRVSDQAIRDFVEPVLRHERDEHAIQRWMADLTDRDLRAVHADLGRLDVPTLLVWGTDDVFFPVDDARRLAALIPGAWLVEVPGPSCSTRWSSPTSWPATCVASGTCRRRDE